jgi:hypothetical protein
MPPLPFVLLFLVVLFASLTLMCLQKRDQAREARHMRMAIEAIGRDSDATPAPATGKDTGATPAEVPLDC